MEFTAWGNLLVLPIVAFVAWLVLRRPGVRVESAGSLRLWREVLASGRGGESTLRRATWSWVLLLVGAVAAVLAAAGPEIEFQTTAKPVFVRVAHQQWIAPDALAEAKSILETRYAPSAVYFNDSPTLDGRTFQLRPATRETAPDGWIALPANVGSVTLEQFGASVAGPTRTEWGVKALVTLRNWSTKPQNVTFHLPPEEPFDGEHDRTVTIEPLSTKSIFPLVAHKGDSFTVSAKIANVPLFTAISREQSAQPIRVAVVGTDSPWVRRAIHAAGATLVATQKEADVVIAIGQPAPADKPSLTFGVEHSVLGWQAHETYQDAAVLKSASWPQADALTTGLNFSPVAVATLCGWYETDISRGRSLLTLNKRALILQSEPDAPMRQIAVTITPDPEESNWPLTPSFALFLDRAMGWLAKRGELGNSEVVYRSDPNNPPLGLRAGAGDWRAALTKAAKASPGGPTRERFALAWLLGAAALGCWLSGWALAARRFER
ncbi:MAG: hypothetical protein HN909_04995 [Phycisphaerales bacterium]|nr:hypothetical protein [Phycisphaerales bacterium]MBT7171109.1 hypothetical protein [Phycisphaerales bacterium]